MVDKFHAAILGPEREALALGGAQLGVWSADLATGALECDERHCRINGHDPATPPRTPTTRSETKLPSPANRIIENSTTTSA